VVHFNKNCGALNDQKIDEKRIIGLPAFLYTNEAVYMARFGVFPFSWPFLK
jgi:hypothetical protein